jgi:hypothetical protein
MNKSEFLSAVRAQVAHEDPPGGALSERAASMLLDGVKDARAGRLVPLDLSLLDGEQAMTEDEMMAAVHEYAVNGMRRVAEQLNASPEDRARLLEASEEYAKAKAAETRGSLEDKL